MIDLIQQVRPKIDSAFNTVWHPTRRKEVCMVVVNQVKGGGTLCRIR